MHSTRYWNVNKMVSTNPNDMVNAKISERQISDARNVQEGLEINNLGVEKTKWRRTSRIFDLECVNCGIMRVWKSTVKLGG